MVTSCVQSDNIVVTVGVHDSYHRKGQLHTARNSKSEQSSRAPPHAHEGRRGRRLQKQQSDVGQQQHRAAEEVPAVEHVVRIGNPPGKPAAAAAGVGGGSGGVGGGGGGAVRTAGGGSAGAQSRFDAFDDDEDDFFGEEEDGGNLSDDSLTLGGPRHRAAVAEPPRGKCLDLATIVMYALQLAPLVKRARLLLLLLLLLCVSLRVPCSPTLIT